MLAANEFELDELTNQKETLLIDTKASWLKKYFSLIYQNYCNDIIAKHPNIIFENSDFAPLSESALVSLLKRDGLQMVEVKIWDYIIKWGIFQNPTLPTNLEEWSNENFFTLKTTLQHCLPLIRYFHISGTEIFDKIRPYKKLLDKQLWLDINQHLVAPDRPIHFGYRIAPRAEIPNEPFSTIISEEHAAEISSWIDRKTTTYSTMNIPYKFELILSGTRDGNAPQTFWDICRGHAKTVVVAKVKGTDEILGGYNPLVWNNTHDHVQWMKTKDSFIFSLKMALFKIQNTIIIVMSAIIKTNKTNIIRIFQNSTLLKNLKITLQQISASKLWPILVSKTSGAIYNTVPHRNNYNYKVFINIVAVCPEQRVKLRQSVPLNQTLVTPFLY
ncbi:hypothetical protein Glove_164g4 [Diversispora epigaea]|uniref:TLDc domain-containing protein n=1 Tax=Diversispora epigaea TaxID=1348612 RepID=A0A397IR85_9GLOM|nr:hypothetical protein Glove_164g4 [Diversispora epigaea]